MTQNNPTQSKTSQKNPKGDLNVWLKSTQNEPKQGKTMQYNPK